MNYLIKFLFLGSPFSLVNPACHPAMKKVGAFLSNPDPTTYFNLLISLASPSQSTWGKMREKIRTSV
jgi:hypothetical protein